jgi:hypothetical protein
MTGIEGLVYSLALMIAGFILGAEWRTHNPKENR